MSGEVRKELLGVVFFGLFIFLGVSLISYSPFDVSFHTVSSRPTQNLCGKVGSYTADLIFQIFGIMGFLIAFFFLFLSFLYIRKREITQKAPFFSGVGLFFLSASILLQSILGEVDVKGVRMFFSGLLGFVLKDGLERLFGQFGSLFISSLFLFISLFFLLQAPIIEAIEKRFKRRRPVERRKEIKIRESERERQERRPHQETLDFVKDYGPYKLPSISLLDYVEKKDLRPDRETLRFNASLLEKKLKDYGIEGRVVEVRPGPVITLYEFEPAPGIKVSRIANLEDDLAMALSAYSVRIVAPIPGKSVVGIEVPNRERQTIYLREILESETFQSSTSVLTLALGMTISGEPFVADLSKMPHLLVAGATGSGKSVALNSMICSILFKATPLHVRFIMIDLKMLELSHYEEIPHLLLPVVTSPKNAKVALKWLIEEMERRYTIMAEKGSRNIERYNQKVSKEGGDIMPYIVIVIDELADLMIVSTKEVEEYIARLAQMARASGIHLVLATQRPSVDVLTGIIKANIPARIACQVSSKVDSRTIIDASGAETLLGAGDMLFMSPGLGKLMRLHGPFVSEGEIRRIVDFLKTQGRPEYRHEILEETEGEEEPIDDEKYTEAVQFVMERGEASISMIQRRFRIGYNRAARIVERMEKEGIVGPSDGVKPREVLKRWR